MMSYRKVHFSRLLPFAILVTSLFSHPQSRSEELEGWKLADLVYQGESVIDLPLNWKLETDPARNWF